MKFLDKTKDPHLKVVLYGKQGTGKTTLSSTFPKPAILLDIKENGWVGVREVKGLDIAEIKDWEDIEEAYWYLKDNKEGYKTVIVDTVSALQDLALDFISKKRNSKKKLGDFGTMSRREWGEVSGMLKPIITDFRDLNMNVVFISHEKVFNVEEDDRAEGIDPSVGPKLMQSVASTMNAAVDIVGNTFIREKKRDNKPSLLQYCLRVGPHPYYITKVRKPLDVEVDSVLVDCSYQDLIELIKGE